MSEIDVTKLKEMIKALNNAKYKNDDEEEVSFLETPIKISIGASTAKLAIAFATAINSLEDAVTGQLPDAVIDFYNDTDFPTEESEKTEKEETTVAKAKAKEVAKKEEPKAKEAVKKEAPKAKEAAKKETTKKSGKKEPTPLSVFGHKGNSQAAKIDALLAPGKSVTLEELVKGSGRSELGVKGHIKHLIETRNLTINVKDNVYRYVKNASK